MSKKIVMLGSGGHASVLADITRRLNKSIYAFLSPQKPNNTILFSGAKHWDNDNILATLSPDEYIILNGIGSLPGSLLRKKLANQCQLLGLEMMTLIAPDSFISSDCRLAEGVQVMSRVVIQPGCVIGHHAIINTGVIVEHDCSIGDYTHLSPASVLSGGVTLGESVHIGTNATIIQNISIENHCVIGAGVTVNKNIPANTILYPARPHMRSLNDVQ